MEPNPILFRDLTYIFVAAVAGGLAAWRLRLPLILGFVLGGIAISPFTPGPRLADLHPFEGFAEIGVVFLMFSIGFEFSVKDLLRVKWVALVGAPLGILAITGIATVVGRLAGWSTPEAVVIGAAVSVASTMVLARLLADAGKLTESCGRVMIGITLIEDLAVICMTLAIPVFAGGSGNHRIWQAVWTLGRAVLLLIPLGYIAVKVIPRVLRRVKRTCNNELYLLVVVAVCLGTAELAQAVGFSVALGAFLAGLAISGLDDLDDAHTILTPLRDTFVALFFVSLGALIDPKMLIRNLPLLATMLGLIVIVKFVVWASVVWLFRYPVRTAIFVATGLTQIGELSFVLVQAAHASRLVGDNVFGTLIAASLISILINVFLMRLVLRWVDRPAAGRPAASLERGAGQLAVRGEKA